METDNSLQITPFIDSTLPPWNDDIVGRVVEEMEALFLENQKEVLIVN